VAHADDDTSQPGENAKGLVFNIQRFSIHDGPGIRTTVFMKGCPLSCLWCSNPESQAAYPEILTLDRKCIQCGKCIEACPRGAITLGDSKRRIDRDRCDRCLICAEICSTGAIEIAGTWKDVNEVLTEIQKDEPFYRRSGGGVTLSGGEPLLQWKFVSELLKECKKKGFHTALDTSGCAPWDVIEKVLEYLDLVLYDIKLIDPAKHMAATGLTNEIILSNAAQIAGRKRTWLRYAVIPGYNDLESTAKEIAAFASRLPIEKVSLLPFHAFGAQKYERLARNYPLTSVSPPTDEHLQRLAAIFDSFGLDVTVGY
jgi:pyruvate formate lyase activating enzyme